MHLPEFIAKWTHSTLTERSAAQSWFLDLCRVLGVDAPSATEAELKKRTLTNLYNERPTWLQNLHAALDRAVWDAYGWPPEEVPADIQEEAILVRLLDWNRERVR